MYYDFFVTRILPLLFDVTLYDGVGLKIFFYMFSIGSSLLVAVPFIFTPVFLYVRMLVRKKGD